MAMAYHLSNQFNENFEKPKDHIFKTLGFWVEKL